MDVKEHIEGLKQGSYNDFNVLYDRFAGNLYGFVYGLTRSRIRAQDIVQETFMKVWINREGFELVTSFRSYLFTVARNLLVDSYRRQLKDPVFGDYLDNCDAALKAGNTVEAKIDFDLFQKRLSIAKNKLTASQRKVFELAKERGMAPSEIACLSGVSVQTVKNQLSQALRIVKQELGALGFMLVMLFP